MKPNDSLRRSVIDVPCDASPVAADATSGPLDAFFRPRTIALIGASEAPGSAGRSLAENLLSFPGRVFWVNPHHPSILGIEAYPSIRAVPVMTDLAIIATPATTVPGVVRECAEAGVAAVIIISAGFKESGAAGRELERQTCVEAARGGVRLLGPNCLGLMAPYAGLNATFASPLASPGKVAFVSQSGALCSAFLDWSRRQRVGFSAFVSVGSMADVSWGDLIRWLGRDPLTESILIYMEAMTDARGFLEAAREVAPVKPIVVMKVGHTEAAARAAASHTGAITGSDAVLDAAFRAAGVLRVTQIGELFDLAEVLARQPLPQGSRLAIVTNAGGPGALATDALVGSGGALATLTGGTLAALNQLLPPPWSHANPVDILGDAEADRFSGALTAVLNDREVDGALVILTPQSMTNPTACARAVVQAARGAAKPILASWMGATAVAEGRRILCAAGIPAFEYPDAAARSFALLCQRERNLSVLKEPQASAEWDASAAGATAGILDAALAEGVTFLPKSQCHRILEAYGLPSLEVVTAATVTEAVQGALRIGYPVVMKLHSGTVTHKTEAGGVKLGLHDEAAVRRAWQEIKAAVSTTDFLGVTIEPMISVSEGYELIVGCSQDPQFGPVLLFGTGGQLVEVFKDSELALPPLTASQARRLIERPRIAAALHGIRGRPPVDLERLADVIVGFSHLVVDHPRIREIEINPLLITPRGLIALDVRIILQGQNPEAFNSR